MEVRFVSWEPSCWNVPYFLDGSLRDGTYFIQERRSPVPPLTTDLIPNQASHFCTSVITFVQVSGTIFVNQSRIFIRPSPLSTRPMTPIPAPCSWFSCRHLELMLALSSSCPGLLQWFLQFGVHRNHLVVLLKHRLLTPTSKLLYQRSGLEINL